jgi:hypothetical protein
MPGRLACAACYRTDAPLAGCSDCKVTLYCSFAGAIRNYTEHQKVCRQLADSYRQTTPSAPA